MRHRLSPGLRLLIVSMVALSIAMVVFERVLDSVWAVVAVGVGYVIGSTQEWWTAKRGQDKDRWPGEVPREWFEVDERL